MAVIDKQHYRSCMMNPKPHHCLAGPLAHPLNQIVELHQELIFHNPFVTRCIHPDSESRYLPIGAHGN